MRLPRVLRPISRVEAALHGVTALLGDVAVALAKLTRVQEAAGPATARLEALELSRHQWEATCEGLLQKAQGKFHAAQNAEARERANKRSYAHLIDPFPEDGVEPEAPTRDSSDDNDVAPSQAEGVRPVRVDVAPTNKTLAQRAKFGVR